VRSLLRSVAAGELRPPAGRARPPVVTPGGAEHSFARVSVLQRQPRRRPRPARPALNDYPTRDRCREPEVSIVIAAFNQGLREVAQARNRVVDYLTTGSDRANCALVRSALRRHFGWTEAVRQELMFPDIPCHILQVFDDLLAAPPTPETWCQTPPPPRTEQGVHVLANAGGDPNVYTFFGRFFHNADAGLQALTAIHEMMHKPIGMSDTAYRFQPHYGSSPRSMQNNPDSFASLAHDLGSEHPVVGNNPCRNGVLPSGTTTACR